MDESQCICSHRRAFCMVYIERVHDVLFIIEEYILCTRKGKGYILFHIYMKNASYKICMHRNIVLSIHYDELTRFIPILNKGLRVPPYMLKRKWKS